MEKEIKLQKKAHLVNSDQQSGAIDSIGKIKLSGEQIRKAMIGATAGSTASSIPVLRKVFEWMERVNQNAREEKLRILLGNYAGYFASIKDAILKLKNVVATREGQILFRKVVQILDKGDDKEWIGLLASYRKHYHLG